MAAALVLAIIVLTAFAQIAALATNVWIAWGLVTTSVIVTYAVASMCYLIIHWAEPYVEELSHLNLTKFGLLAAWVLFCFNNELLPHMMHAGFDEKLVTLGVALVAVEALAHVQRQAIAALIRIKSQKDH